MLFVLFHYADRHAPFSGLTKFSGRPDGGEKMVLFHERMPAVCNCKCGRDAATIFNRDREAWDDVCVFIFVLVEVDIKKYITQ